MYVTLHFDVEDTVYPPEARTDDVPGWIAQTLSKAGLRGTFHVIGDKARAMLQRNRLDALASMAEHDISIHTDSNNHPVVPEMVEHCGWADGVERLVEYETRAAEALKKAFWKMPVATSRHAVFTAPQSHGAAAELGLPYVYSWAYCPGHAGPVWFAGSLCFPTHCGAGESVTSYLSFGPEGALSRDDAFEAQLRRLGEELDRRVAAGIECLTLFVAHPVRVLVKGWTEDELFANGRNRTMAELGFAYELRTAAEMETARANFARLCAYLKSRQDLQVIGIGRAAELFARQAEAISRDTLREYCSSGEDALAPRLHAFCSPAELLVAMADSLVAAERRGALPRAVARRRVLGPVAKPVLVAERPFASYEEFLGLCRALVEQVDETGHLPANLPLGDARVGLGSLHAACVTAFRAACAGERLARLRLPKVPRYPAAAHELEKPMGWIEECGFLGPDFSADRLRLHMRLQTWSLKPARTRVPSGPCLEAGGFVRADAATAP
ncbi:MAG TPA: hypothetical protein P5118_11420 [Planctomycetota bacterium]|nr:hypothetical protein [Planctomycetota bacterium]